jgi:hypothetical protein
MLFVRNEKRLPSNVFKTGPGTPYSVYTYVAQEKGGIAAIKKYVTISDADGRVFETKVRQYDTFGHPFWEVDDRECFEGVGVISPAVVSAATSINLYSDRKNYWNVMAYEDDGARALFGVEEEEVKSLFYSRSLPLTDTGRKRPILHWVAAHKRRLAAGTEIDIEKFLRGTNEFVMSGTKFMITRPERQPKGNELRMQPE